MQKLITASGKNYDINWCGPSTIDYALRFSLPKGNMQEVLRTFTDASETIKLTHIFDEHATIFDGYTEFKGVDLQFNGDIVVALNHSSEAVS